MNVEQTTVQPTNVEEITVQPTNVEETTVQPTNVEETTVQPTNVEQTTVQPTNVEQTTVQPTNVEETTVQPTNVEQTTVQPTNVEQTTVQPTNVGQTTVQSVSVYETIAENQNIENTNQVDIRTHDWFLVALDKLLEEIKDTKKGISKKWLTKAWKKTMDEAKNKLNQYEKILKGKKKTLKKQKTAEVYDSDISNLRNMWEQTNKVREDIWMWQRWNFANTASYLYNSPEIAKKSNEYQTGNIEFNQDFQKDLKTWAILNIFNWDVEKANKFFRRIAEWEYTQADYQLYVANSAVLNPYFQKYRINTPCKSRCRRVSWTGVEGARIGVERRKVDYSNMDWGDTLQEWWVAGVFDKLLSSFNNMTPWQRETWKSLAVLGCFAGWIYSLYKFYTNKQMWFRSKAWITAWAIFGSQVLTWEWPLSLFNKLMFGGLSMDELKGSFGNAVGTLGASGMTVMWNEAGNDMLLGWWGESASETVVPAMYSMMIFNSSTKVSDIQKMTQSFNNNDNRKIFYDKSCNKLKKEYGTQAMETFRATFSDKYDETKRTERLASIGVVLWTTNVNESLYWLANNAAMNKTILEKFKADNWLKENGNKELKAYIKSKKENNEAIDVDDLNEHIHEWFDINNKATYTERPEDIQNKQGLSNEIELLSIDADKKEELKVGIQEFYDDRAVEAKPNLSDFSIKMENGYIVLTSHWWESTKIDINKREIIWFWKGIRFTNLAELLNTADLANKILESQKWKTPKWMPPFQYKWPTMILENWIGKEWRWIYFNDADGRSLDFDTRVLSWGWWWTIWKIDTLCNHPEEFADYLSNRWSESNKVNIDNTRYPMVKELSDLWIVFTDESEAQKVENLLNYIKHELRMRQKREPWDAFEIQTWLTTKKYITFFTIWWNTKEFDISDYPTLIRNAPRLLQYLNNPDKKMRGSEWPA